MDTILTMFIGIICGAILGFSITLSLSSLDRYEVNQSIEQCSTNQGIDVLGLQGFKCVNGAWFKYKGNN